MNQANSPLQLTDISRNIVKSLPNEGAESWVEISNRNPSQTGSSKAKHDKNDAGRYFFPQSTTERSVGISGNSTAKTKHLLKELGEACCWGLFSALLGAVFIALTFTILPCPHRTSSRLQSQSLTRTMTDQQSIPSEVKTQSHRKESFIQPSKKGNPAT